MLRIESESTGAGRAIGKRGNGLLRRATDCTTIHAAVARTIWPHKTAEHWAAESGSKPRMAKYWLAGSHTVSAGGRLALIRKLAA